MSSPSPIAIDRRAFLSGLALSVVVVPLAAAAQTPPKVPKVGYLSIGSASDPRRIALLDAFRQGLSGLGYIENRSISIEARFAERSYDRLADLAAGLVRLRDDLIVTHSTPAAQAARD